MVKGFAEYVAEGNPLVKIDKKLKSGTPVGTISPETGDSHAKKDQHAKMQGDLKRLSKKGYLSYTGPHQGRYKYDGDKEPSKEGSYVVSPRKATAHRHFDRIIKGLGSRYKQQSVLRVKPSGEGDLMYTDKSKKVEPMGKIHYNQKLGLRSGDTKFKGKNSTFTVKE
jgi:hypothetical protein